MRLKQSYVRAIVVAIALRPSTVGILGCSPSEVERVVEHGWELHGTVSDAVTAGPITGATVAIGLVYSDGTHWHDLAESDSTGTYYGGSIGRHPDFVRFSKQDYDTAEIVLADSAIVESAGRYITWYRFDAHLEEAAARIR